MHAINDTPQDPLACEETGASDCKPHGKKLVSSGLQEFVLTSTGIFFLAFSLFRNFFQVYFERFF